MDFLGTERKGFSLNHHQTQNWGQREEILVAGRVVSKGLQLSRCGWHKDVDGHGDKKLSQMQPHWGQGKLRHLINVS